MFAKFSKKPMRNSCLESVDFKKQQCPSSKKYCRYNEGNSKRLYTEALEIDQFNKKTNAKLYFNRATALARLIKAKEAISDCTAALKLDEGYLKALLRRAKCYMDIGEYEDAVRDYEKVKKWLCTSHAMLTNDAVLQNL
ncbi:unnamed protein product [Acanthoscelides obtectus]|uniref:Uncharacterized protein n=1 Tax=Acanthoscelides obtectus TaxID=200917 RepID=A0A9P0Q910_ACAOB|nr:unnamed protein product [Acanthoscelides obtectus]CAK1620068.1 DnaJ homolog subfamily C member 7 [Acanthoscelides obtectus]